MGSRYPADGSRAAEPTPLAVGDRVRLDWDAEWWTVQAVSSHFAACTRPVTDADRAAQREWAESIGEEDYPYDDEDGPMYTVLDWRNGVRGPCDLIGQAWGDGTYSPVECAELLAAFEITDDDIHAAMTEHNINPPGQPLAAFSENIPHRLEVSQRNWVPLRIIEHAPAPAPATEIAELDDQFPCP